MWATVYLVHQHAESSQEKETYQLFGKKSVNSFHTLEIVSISIFITLKKSTFNIQYPSSAF